MKQKQYWVPFGPAENAVEKKFREIAEERVSSLITAANGKRMSLTDMLLSAYCCGFEDCFEVIKNRPVALEALLKEIA